jgi:hypothetical protein
MSDGVSESRASSLAKGFEKPAPAWLAQEQPCVSLPCILSVSIRVIRGSQNDSAIHNSAKEKGRETSVQRRESLKQLLLPHALIILPSMILLCLRILNPSKFLWRV